jgi:DNA-binding NarL/FixJ family response regulator
LQAIALRSAPQIGFSSIWQVTEERFNMARPPRIFIADDHTLLVDAFRKLLEPEFEIVGTAADGKSLLALAPQLRPDLVVIDLGLPLLNGVDAGQLLKERLPKARLLVVTMNEDAILACEVLRRWADGYLLKKSAATELIHAMRELLAGRSYVTPQIAIQLEKEFVRGPEHREQASLTFRQREVLQLLAEGCSMKEAAYILQLTTRTVAFHKYKIMQKFSLNGNLDLLKLAVREHLVSD